MAGTLTIGGTNFIPIEDTFDLTTTLDERQRFKCDVIDYTGTYHFVKGEQVTYTDPLLGVMFNGYINTDKEVIQYPTSLILHSIDCIGQQYIADKRTFTGTYTTTEAAGELVLDQAYGVLLQEGLTQNFAHQLYNTNAGFNTGILTNTAGYTTPNYDDLELLKAGSDVSINEVTTANFSTGTLVNMSASSNALIPSTVHALKFQSFLTFAYGVQFAQSQQSGTASGNATGTVSGNATGTVSGTATGSTSGTVNSSGGYTPAGSVNISGGNPGESASFTGSFATLNVSGNYSDFNVNVPFSTFATLPFSTSASLGYSSTVSVNPVYLPTTTGKVKISDNYYVSVTADVTVSDNRIDALIWSGSLTIGTHDTLNYDIWIASTSPSEAAGIELYFSDGTALTEYLGTIGSNTDVGVWDQNGVSVDPIQDLSDYAKDCWYTRNFDLSILVGKTILGVSIFNSGNTAGTYDVYIKNCYLGSASGSPFFGTSQTTPNVNPPTIASLGAYNTANAYTTVVQPYVPANSYRISPAYSIDAAKIVKGSFISWTTTNPLNGPTYITGSPGSAKNSSAATFYVSYDATTWLQCTNNAPIPGLPAGMNVSGMNIYFMESFEPGEDPSAIPTYIAVTADVYSAPNTTTSTITASYGTTAQWNTGTEDGVAPNSNGDLVLNKTSYTWSTLNNMTFTAGNTTSSNPVPSVSGGKYIITSPSMGSFPHAAWSDTRFNFVAAALNFTLEADFNLNSHGVNQQNEIGFLYRQTYWGNPNNSFGYYIRIMQQNGVTFGYGINNPPPASGAGYSVIYTSTQTVSDNTTYHMKVVVTDNRHTVYWNNGTNPIIDILDNTYTAPGNFGVRTYATGTSSGSTNSITNFTVTNTFAGFWISPSINLNSLGTVGNTQVAWSETNNCNDLQQTALVFASLDGGSTYQQCTNAGVDSTKYIPGLAPGTSVVGKSLLIQIILSATGFLEAPIIKGLYVSVCKAYGTVSGNRSTIPLGNDLMIRANQSGWGTAFDGQTWSKVGVATDSISSNEALLSNTTGDVHEVLGSRTFNDEDGTVRFSLSNNSIHGGMELRYTNSSNYYRLDCSTSSISIIKNVGGGNTTLATTSLSLSTGTFYRMRFRVINQGPVLLYGKIWLDGTLEPGVVNGIFSSTNPMWTIQGSD